MSQKSGYWRPPEEESSVKKYKVTVDGKEYVIRAENKNDAKLWGTKQNPDFMDIRAEEIKTDLAA